MNSVYLGVVGRPIIQSLSPLIHEMVLKFVAKQGAYLRLAVESLDEAISVSEQMGLRGINVTAPFKEQSQETLTGADKLVLESGALNTIIFDDPIRATNTDIYGVQRALGLSPGQNRADGKTALIIGAGGAARATVYALKSIGCRVFITNRTIEKAEEIALTFGCKAISFEESADLLKVADYIINAVFSHQELISLDYLQPNTLILDAIYARETPLSLALRGNPNYISGKEWLIHQGIRAAGLFLGCSLTEEQIGEIHTAIDIADRRIPSTISLIGMMGSGKSSVLDSLRSVFGRDVVDLDQVIEEQAGMSILRLCEEKGEPTFRALEAECLERILLLKPKVLACGGGVLGKEENKLLLSAQSLPVWLWASKEELAKRLQRFSNRPLLAGYDLQERLGHLLEERFHDYASVSELVVPTDGKMPTEIARRIAFEVASAT